MVDPKDAPIIYIIGPNYFQNELLASFLKKEVGLECRHNTALNPTALIDPSGSQQYLLLLDCAEGEGIELLKTPEVETVLRIPQCLLVFFNVDPRKEEEGELVRHRVRGAFYRSDPPRMLVKGVVAILEGELWYSRKILSKFLLREKSIDAPAPGPARDAGTFLTPREREVLLWVAAGESNQAIADKLAISLHTVKTHIYRIFKKIQVPNRFQAALWAAKYLDA